MRSHMQREYAAKAAHRAHSEQGEKLPDPITQFVVKRFNQYSDMHINISFYPVSKLIVRGAQKKMKFNYYNKTELNIIKKKIPELINGGKTSFIIYPCGNVSNMVKNIINQHGGKIAFYIDNHKNDGINIYNINEAKSKVNQDDIILICSTNAKYYDEIRANIYNSFPRERVVDLFSENELVNAGILISDERLMYDIKYFKDFLKNVLKDDNAGKLNAYALAEYMLKRSVIIEDDDIFAGRIRCVTMQGMVPDFDEEMSSLKNRYGNMELFDYIIDAEKTGLFCRNPGNHFAPAYDVLLKCGLGAQINKYSENLTEAKKAAAKDDCNRRKIEFYENELILQKAFQERIVRYGQAAGKKYELQRTDNLKKISECCERISNDRPIHFFDAIQLLIFAHELVVSEAGCGSISFGRLDMYLYPFYRFDIDNGYIHEEEAIDYLVALWKKIADLELSWQNITIGGVYNEGNDCCNELTLMCMKAASIVRGDQPQLSLRITKDTPDEVWDAAIDLIKEGMGFPSLFNDDIAIQAKKNAGVSEEDAKNYCVMGCVELCIPGKEYAHTEGARLNWAKILELVLKGISSGKYADTINSFEQFYDLYKKELVYHTRKICSFIDIASENYSLNWQVPFASSLMYGTDIKAKDVTDNGTVYNNLCVNCVGFATTVDSLQAIRELVYDRNDITITDLCRLLYEEKDCDIRREDFSDCVKQKMLSCSKYGNDIDDVDFIAADLSKVFCQALADYKPEYRTGKIMPGFYTSYFHADFGKFVGNTPDGRKKETPLSGSLSPTAGKDVNGPLSLFNSANKIDMTPYGNGMALDVKFLPSFFDKKENREALKTAIKVYFDNGGMEVQFNVVDKDTLIKAQEQPENYQNLMVRVSGFSAHFVRLEKNLQNEIIQRTEHI